MKNTLKFSATLVLLAGFLSLATGIWFLVDDHPFQREFNFLEEVGVSKAQLEELSPNLVPWAMHEVDTIGYMSMGWGLFVMILGWFGIRQVNKVAWWALLIGGAPPLFRGTIAEFVRVGEFDVGIIISSAVAVLYLVGLFLPYKFFFKKEETKV